jgi:hypothetical protein
MQCSFANQNNIKVVFLIRYGGKDFRKIFQIIEKVIIGISAIPQPS